MIFQRSKLEYKLKQNRNEIITLIRKIGRSDLDSDSLEKLDQIQYKIMYKPTIHKEVFVIESLIISHLLNLHKKYASNSKVVYLYLDTVLELIDQRNDLNKEESMLFKNKKKSEYEQSKVQAEKDLELKAMILSYESKIMDTIDHMNKLIEKGKNPDLKKNSFEFNKLERDYNRLEDNLKTYEEVLEGLNETIDQNNKLANIEVIAHALLVSQRLRSKTFEEATKLVKEVQIERNLAEEERVKFRELKQQYDDGAPVKTDKPRSTFIDKIEERKVDELKETIEKGPSEKTLINQNEE